MPRRKFGVAQVSWALQLVWEDGFSLLAAAKATGVSRQTIRRTVLDFNLSVRFKVDSHVQSSSEFRFKSRLKDDPELTHRIQSPVHIHVDGKTVFAGGENGSTWSAVLKDNFVGKIAEAMGYTKPAPPEPRALKKW